MPKTTKPERKALFALDDAAAAARFAKQAAKTLPAKQAKKLRELAEGREGCVGCLEEGHPQEPAKDRQACRQGHGSGADGDGDRFGPTAGEGCPRR